MTTAAFALRLSKGERFLRMHVLREPVERHFATGAFRFGGVLEFPAHRRELRSHAEIIDEAGNLTVGFSPFDFAR